MTADAKRAWGWVILVAGCLYQAWAFIDSEFILLLFGLAHVIGGTSLIAANRRKARP